MSLLRSLTAATLLVAGPAFAAAPIQTLTSPDGHDFWLVSEDTIPMVAVEISFRGGAASDPDDKLGAANFLSAMLDEGAGDLDTVAFSARAQLLAANFSFSAGRDSLTVSARMLTENLDDSVALLRDALVSPRLDPEPLTRVRAQILASLRSDQTDPNALASKAWFAAAFPDHPYGRPTDGTLETVEALTADDLRAAHARLLSREGAVVGVVGAIDAGRAGAMVDTLLADLPQAAPPPPPMAQVATPGRTEIVPLPAPQTTVMFGHGGLLRDDPDFMPAFVMNYVLGGGGFSSRLTTEVREKRGLAYSTYSYLAPLDRAGIYLGGVGTANERVAESMEVIRAEWTRMAEEGVTEEELAKAKQYLTGAYPLRFDSNGKIAGILVGLQENGFGPEYVEQRNDLIEAVTQDDIRRVAERLLQPADLIVVAVGQPVGLETPTQ